MRISTALLCLLTMVAIPVVEAVDSLDGIVAKVDQRIITVSDLNEAMAITYMGIREQYPEDQWDTKLKEEQKRILDRMIDDLVCLRFARENSIVISDEQVDEQINGLKEKAGIQTDDEFNEALRQEGLTLDELRDNTRENIIKQRVLGREVYSKIEVKDGEIKKYYHENESLFKKSASVKIGLLFLELKEGDDSDNQATEEKIQMIYEQLKAGAAFNELVKEYSQGPSKDSGGDIGFIKKGEGLPELEKIAFSMKAGEFSKPFKTGYGWNIVKVLEYIPEKLVPLVEVEDNIRNVLQRMKARDVERDWLEAERSKTYIEIIDRP